MEARKLAPFLVELYNPTDVTYEDIVLERRTGSDPFELVPGAPRWLPPGGFRTFRTGSEPLLGAEEVYRGQCINVDANQAFEFGFRFDPDHGVQDWRIEPVPTSSGSRPIW